MLRDSIRRAHSGWQEIACLVLLYGVYELARGIRVEDLRAADAHAQLIVRLERSLDIYSEHAVQQFATRIPLLVHVLAILYPALHVIGTVGALVWLYRARRPAFPFVRTALVLTSAFALVVYVAYPVAPPRLAIRGFVDTVSRQGPFDLGSTLLGRFYNPVAAVPSLHLGYALLVGGAVAWQVRRPTLRFAALLYPFVALFVVVATGNHFFFDAATGAAVAAVATVGAWLLVRDASASETVRRRASRVESASSRMPRRDGPSMMFMR